MWWFDMEWMKKNAIDVTNQIITYLLSNRYIDLTTNIHDILPGPPPGIKKNLYIYHRGDRLIIREHGNHLTESIFMNDYKIFVTNGPREHLLELCGETIKHMGARDSGKPSVVENQIVPMHRNISDNRTIDQPFENTPHIYIMDLVDISIRYGVDEKNAIDCTKFVVDRLLTNRSIDRTTNIRDILRDPRVGYKKNMYIYHQGDRIVIGESGNHLNESITMLDSKICVTNVPDEYLKAFYNLDSHKNLASSEILKDDTKFQNFYFDKLNEFCEIEDIVKNDVLTNQKQEFRYFCYRYLDYIKMIELPEIQKSSIYESVLIEFRCLPHLEFLIRNSIYKLGKKWSHTVVCGIDNYEFINKIITNIDRNIKIIKLNYKSIIHIDEYTDLLSTVSFWELFHGEKILIYQEDSCIFKNNIDEFLEWDYIGAPWPLEYKINIHGVGNGGFSLRSKSVMLECLKQDTSVIGCSQKVSEYMIKNNLIKIPEDVYFTNIMELYSIGKLADNETAKKFSSESFATDSLGGHQFWINNTNFKNVMYSNVIKTFVPNHMSFYEHRGGWGVVVKRLYDLNIYNKESDIVFYDLVEKDFMWGPVKCCNKKWFGIVHCTENTPPYLASVDISYLFVKYSHFLKHVDKCLFLIALSPNVVNYLRTNLRKLNIKVAVYLLAHPIDDELNIQKFSIDKFIKNDNKKLLQIGQQLRKITSIYLLNNIDYKRVWLTGTKNFSHLRKLFDSECKYLGIDNIDINDIEMKYTNTFEEYDELLSENIVFINLFDAAANNTVLECILRRTPIIINRLMATEYYLGTDYPLFFDDIKDVPKLLTIDNFKKAHEYLQNLKLSSVDNFIASIINILAVR